MVETEKTTRVERETFILGKLSDEVFKIQQQMGNQRDERNLKIKELQDHVNHELQSQTKYNEGNSLPYCRIPRQELQGVQHEAGIARARNERALFE